ncbi:protein kinase domain-containing protein [Gimesia chilikensis]|uniref:serine/threonine protein kinase n=1 Tax=Gimesia chilikensis TaxID=2605989 RepID=UPI003A93BC71
MNQPSELENLTAEIQIRIEESCEEYELSWQSGQTPSLEDTIADFAPPTREILLQELILIERYYRLRDSGKIISEQELIQEHPEIADELSRLFAKTHATKTRIAGESDSGQADSSGLRTVEESRLHFEQFPATFGRYQILSRLGEGGMGCVYLARDTQLERKVALKLPQIDKHADAQFIARFYREARAAANLNHPNLCSVYDVDEIDGVHYITMEFIEGESLATLLQEGKKFNQVEVVDLIQQLSQALGLAHQQGIVHRDLKPANVMIRQDGTPIITDFGLALMSQNEEATQITQHGQIMGSPSYMSPEQVEGDLEKIGPASDIYSLGVIMYELLSGQRPFQGTTASILSQIMTKDPRPVRNIQPDVNSRLDQICRKMMARSAEQRYATMQEVAQVLTSWLETDRAVSSRKGLSPGKVLAGMALLAALLLGITFLKPAASKGNLHVTLNDERAQVLLDGQPLELKSGSWNGPQEPGSHELSLRIGEQRLPWGELTTVKVDDSEQRVLASVNGIHIKNGHFEISPADIQSAEISLNWLPSQTPDQSAEVTSPASDQTRSTVSQDADPAEPFAPEREVTEWLIKRGGIVRFNMAHDFKFNIKDIKELPDEPFRLKEIAFERSRNKPLTDLSSLSQLMTLEELNLNQAKVSSAALKGLVLKQAFETLHILQTELKVSDLKEIQGLEFVDTLELGGSQIDDHFAFLEQMPNLRALKIVDILPAELKELGESPLLRQSKLRFLRLRPIGQIDDKIVQRLQTTRPEMTITSNHSGREEHYLGKPVAQQAAVRLLELGCTMEGHEPGRGSQIFSRENLPSKEIAFSLSRVSLPPEMKLTPEIVEDLAALPFYYKFIAKGIRNADLLTGVPGLRRASGVELESSDLTDTAFQKLAEQDPDGYFNIKDTQVTKSLTQQLDQDVPYLSLYSNFGKGWRWLEIVYEELKLSKPNQIKPTETETSPLSNNAQLALERETAEWIIGLGGKVQCRLPDEKKMIGSVDRLPDGDFLVTEIKFNNTGNNRITLSDINRLNRLLALTVLDLTDCQLEPNALSQLRLRNTLQTISIVHTSLKSSDLKTTQGLQFLDTFKISSLQIDDDFQFLEQMPQLRVLALSKISPEFLQKLSQSPFLSHSKLRFLRFEFDGEIDDTIIDRLQTARPGLTIIASDLINNRRYLGVPYARLALERLLDLGCTIRGREPNREIMNFTKVLRPTESGPLRRIAEVTLPEDLSLTPQIVADLAQLSDFFGLVANQVKNADLLADAPVLKRCDGIHLIDSDLTDQGFEALAQRCPICYFNIKGTQVTAESQQRIDRIYPLITFHADPHTGHIWLKDQLPFPDPQSVPSTSELTDDEQIAFERETAEWVINLGGKVSFKKARGTEYLRSRLDPRLLPKEPFRILDIDFGRSNQKITLPSLSRLSRLVTLHSLNIMNCNLEPRALEGFRFNENTTEFNIYSTPLKTSDLKPNMGLEHLDTFKLGAAQVDDEFRFLELMPRLRELHLYSPVPQELEGLARAPGFAKLNLRFLFIASFGLKFEPELIAKLQKVQPGMTVIDTDGGSMNRYLGIPVAREAAIKLLEQGCKIHSSKNKSDSRAKIYDKSLLPSETDLFPAARVILPPGMEITPEIVEALSQLPHFFGLETARIRNADLLVNIPVLRLCGGIQLPDSDLSDQGFAALYRNHPDGFVNAPGTKVTLEFARQIDRDFPYAAFQTDDLVGTRWLNERQNGDRKSQPPSAEQTEVTPFDTERKIAEWVIEMGGYVKCRQRDTESTITRNLPEEPFRIMMIDFRGSPQKPIAITEPDHLSQLIGLQFLKLTGCQFEPGSMKTVRLNQYLRTLIINDTSLNTSDISSIHGLEFLDAFELNGSQIDDDFKFLEQTPNLRALRLKKLTEQSLQALANSSYLPQSKLRILEVDFNDDIDTDLIQKLQSARPGMTLIGVDLIRNRSYLGIPYAKQAADRLIDQGCTITGIAPNKQTQIYSQDLRPSPEVPFHVRDVTLPPGLMVTPKIVSDLSQLPGPFHGLIAFKVKNADLLAEVPILRRCSGIMLDDSDLTDAGLKAFVKNNPDGYFQFNGTEVTSETVKQINQTYPLVTFYARYGEKTDWMKKLADSVKLNAATHQNDE